MATDVTLDARLYQNLLEESGYECVTSDTAEVEKYCTEPIRLVKKNRIAESFAPLHAALTYSCNEGLRQSYLDARNCRSPCRIRGVLGLPYRYLIPSTR